MILYNRYVLLVAFVLLLTTVIMIATGQNALELYYTVYVIEALIITELYVYFNSKARRGLMYVSAVLFGGFIFALLFQVLRILA